MNYDNLSNAEEELSTEYAPPSNERPIDISGVGNRMMIQRPGEQPIDEYGQKVAPETAQRIKANLVDAPISEPDMDFFGLKPPSEDELSAFDKYQAFVKYAEPTIIAKAEKAADEAGMAFSRSIDSVDKAKIGSSVINASIEAAKSKKYDQVYNQERSALDRVWQVETARQNEQKNFERNNLEFRKREEDKIKTQQSALSPEAIRIEGIKFATTGKMPAMGMAGGAARTAIINSAAEYFKENGIDPKTVPAMQNEYNATAKAFDGVKKSVEQIGGFENGLIKNADYALELSKNNFRSNIIPANKVINYFKTQTGDPEIVKFGAALYAAAMEYEKVRTAGTAITSAELSVGAQKKAEEIMNQAHTHKQLTAIMEAMKQDTANITRGRKDTLVNMGNEMRKLGGTFEGYSDKNKEQQTSGGMPQRTEYFTAMRRANPKASDKEINDYLDKKGVR